MYWVPTKKGKHQPVSVVDSDPYQRHPTDDMPGRGISHHASCPDVSDFRK